MWLDINHFHGDHHASIDCNLLPHIITGRNEVVAKVMFLQVCVILFTEGGVLSPRGCS